MSNLFTNNPPVKCWKSLDDVIAIAETNPNQEFWCVSSDAKKDFIMTAAEIKSTIGNFDWTGVNFALITKNVPEGNKTAQYIPKAKPKIIKFISRASIKIKDSFYTMEYGEERQIDNFDEVNIDLEKQALIDDCNKVVDDQLQEIIQMSYKK